MRSVIFVFSLLSSFVPEYLRANPLEEMFSRQGIQVTRQPLAGVDGYVINPFEGNQINRNHYDSRGDVLVRHLVIQYTVVPVEETVRIYTADLPDGRVSGHYVITQREDDKVPAGIPIQVVPEDQRAWAVGRSRWGSTENLNASSIAITNVNKGYTEDDAHRPTWYPFDQDQVEVLGKLSQNVVGKYNISPQNVVGHGDITTRFCSPGPLFPWQRLWEEFRVGAWLTAEEQDPDHVASQCSPTESLPQGRSVEFLLAHLEKYGYHLPSGKEGLLSPENRAVIKAFQAHFSKNGRPELYNSDPDREDMLWIWALVAKYGQES